MPQFFFGGGNYIITRQQKESELPTYKEFLPNFWDCVSGKQAYLAKEDGVICSSFLHFWRIRGASNQKCTHIAKCGFRSSSLIFWTWNRGRKIKWRKNPSILILERGGGCLFCNDISKRKKTPILYSRFIQKGAVPNSNFRLLSSINGWVFPSDFTMCVPPPSFSPKNQIQSLSIFIRPFGSGWGKLKGRDVEINGFWSSYLRGGA